MPSSLRKLRSKAGERDERNNARAEKRDQVATAWKEPPRATVREIADACRVTTHILRAIRKALQKEGKEKLSKLLSPLENRAGRKHALSKEENQSFDCAISRFCLGDGASDQSTTTRLFEDSWRVFRLVMNKVAESPKRRQLS